MKKRASVAFVILSLFLEAGCISFKVKPPLSPENQVESIQLCKEISEKGNLLKPLKVESEFNLGTDKVICLIRLKDVEKKILLQWKWYSPEKKLLRDTGDIAVNEDEKYLEVVTAYDRFKLNTKDSKEGQWMVVFFINHKLAGRKNFTVKKPAE